MADRPVRARWLPALLILLASLVVCETGLRLASSLSPLIRYHLSPPWTRNTLPDPLVGKRLSPYYPGHDHRGYRNLEKRESVEILAVGDSLTYGSAAPPEGAWPSHLERLTGATTYNAGVGSYSPPEYEVIIDELAVLEPRLVILGLFLGNDLIGAYNTVYMEERLQHLKGTDPVLLAALAAADNQETLRAKTTRLLGESGNSRPETTSSKRPQFVLKRTALYRLIRSVLGSLELRRDAPLRLISEDSFDAAAGRRGRVPLSNVGPFRTVFLPLEACFMTMDLSDPRIAEGLRITETVILSIKEKLENRGVDLLVVLLPTKRLAYSELIEAQGADIAEEYFSAVELEGQVTEKVTNFLTDNGIDYVSPLAAIRRLFDQGIPPYKESDDEHPNSDGYQAIAQAIQDHLSRRGQPEPQTPAGTTASAED